VQEIRYDGSQILTDSVTQEQILAALGDPSNKTVALHKPGSAVMLPDGSEFVAQANGSWARLKSAEERAAEARMEAIKTELRRAVGEAQRP